MRRGRVFPGWLLTTTAVALGCALVPGLALGASVRHYGGPTHSLGVHGTPTIQTLRALARAKARTPANPFSTPAPTNLSNSNGGPVMSDVTIYNIFWVPNGNPSPNESLINQFTEDIGGQFVNLLSQYGFENQLGFGGSWVDTKALPSGRDTYTPPGQHARPVLLDTDVQGAIADALNANPQWQPPGLSVLYMVYLPIGTELCNPVPSGGCTFAPNKYHLDGLCAYHGAYTLDSNATVVYGAMPFDGDRMDGCSTQTVTSGYNGSNGPNDRDPANDSEISTASHEIFEALTDPEPLQDAAWTGGTNPVDPSFQRTGEIGDMCAYIYNPDSYSDGGDISINGDRYFIQYEWDNATSSCVLPGGAMVPTHFYTGCAANALPATESGSTGEITLPFAADFFGTTYNSLWVNSNGTVSFNGPEDTYTPFSLTGSQTPIIAPFFANVDTTGQGPPVPSGLVTYGNTTYDGHLAFCVNWRNVGYYQSMTDHLDSFQLLLVQRQDTGPGDFDIMFNYDRVQWDSGGPQVVATDRPAAAMQGFDVAHVGYANGSTNSLEWTGSGQEGALVDWGGNALTGEDNNSSQPGRYIFAVRNGHNTGTDSLSGEVTDTASNPLAGAVVQACSQSLFARACQLATTDAAGDYSFPGLASGGYTVTASPPPGSSLEPVTQPTLLDLVPATLNFQLPGPTGPPPGVTVNGSGTSDGIPTIFWGASTQISYTGGCLFGTADWTVTGENTQTGEQETVDGTMAENPVGSGNYYATIPPLYPVHGQATLTITVTCPNPTQSQTLPMTIYIDPSGAVVDTNGNPIAGATVTLLSSDGPGGPFTPVPNGSAVMSPSNRLNPDTTRADGSFGWDVLAGYYEVRAEKAGCTDPNNPSRDYALTPVMQVPPEVKGLRLVLDCGGTIPPYWQGPPPPPLFTAPVPPSSTAPPGLISSVLGSAHLRTGTRITVSRAGLAAIGASCSGPAGSVCAGRLTLTRTVLGTVQRRVHGHLRSQRLKRTIQLGSVAYRLHAGGTATLHIRLSAAFVKQLRSAGRHGLAVTVSASGAPSSSVSGTARMAGAARTRKS